RPAPVPAEAVGERVAGVRAGTHRDGGQHPLPPGREVDRRQLFPHGGGGALECGRLAGDGCVVVHGSVHPFTAPPARPPTTYRWNAMASSTGGTDAIRPPEATSPKSVSYRPEKSAMATGMVLAAP